MQFAKSLTDAATQAITDLHGGAYLRLYPDANLPADFATLPPGALLAELPLPTPSHTDPNASGIADLINPLVGQWSGNNTARVFVVVQVDAGVASVLARGTVGQTDAAGTFDMRLSSVAAVAGVELRINSYPIKTQ